MSEIESKMLMRENDGVLTVTTHRSRFNKGCVVVALAAFVGGGLAGFFAGHKHHESLDKAAGRPTVNPRTGKLHNNRNYSVFVPDINSGNHHDPDAPWNAPVEHNVNFDPTDTLSMGGNPDEVLFFPGDLDDSYLQGLKVEYEAFNLQKYIEEHDEFADYVFGNHTNETLQQMMDEEDDAEGQGRRVLQSTEPPEFHEPLPCNTNIDCSNPTPLSSLSAAPGQPLTIPCGQCVLLDHHDGGTYTYPTGIRIEGKLLSIPQSNAVIRTTYVLVLGILEMFVPLGNNGVKFSLYGETSITFFPHAEQPNKNVCLSGCNIGKKVIAVAGGILNIHGYPDDCPAWEPLLSASSSITSGGGSGIGTNMIQNPGGDSDSISPFLGYGNTAGRYCPANDDCAIMGTGRNNWPRGISQSGFDLNEIQVGQKYIFDFQVKLLDENELLNNDNEVPVDCTPSANNVWCPFVRVQTRRNGVWQWNHYFDADMVYNSGGWSHFSLVFDAPPEWEGIDVFTLVWAGGPGGSTIVIDDVIFAKYDPPQVVQGAINQLQVTPKAAECWAKPGSEILITSTTRDSHGEQIGIVESVDTATGTITLQTPLSTPPTTVAIDPEQAVEVGLLNRGIVFEADDDVNNPLSGGHLIIYYTRLVKQNIKGIEIRNFGQQGTLGRYPIHFHVCEDALQSVVAKNIVRQSNQRAYVLHGTNNVLLDDNIAYDVPGHAYMLEEGAEEGSTFRHNLGAKIIKVVTKITTSGRHESDDNPGVFWISNARNDFIGNVAAGSEASGFFFETVFRIHGESFYQNPNLVPMFTILGKFENNAVHSADSIGFTSYPPGWAPEGFSTIKNLRVFRCRSWGLFLHNTRNLYFDGGFFANNGYINVWILRGDDITFDQTKIYGTQPGEEAPITCPNPVLTHYGLILHPTMMTEFDNSGTLRGSTVKNVELRHYTSATMPCAGGVYPMTIGTAQNARKTWNAPHSISGLEVDDTSATVLDACKIKEENGMEDISIEVDSNVHGVFSSFPQGFLVSPPLKTFVPHNCVDVGGCLEFCPNTCFRILRINVAAGAVGASAVITAGANKQVLPMALRDRSTHTSNTDGSFTVSLPAGQYRLHFEDGGGQIIWPSYAQIVLESPPDSCDNYIKPGDITVLKPEIGCSCDDLIKSGTFETSLNHWQEINAGFELLPHSGVGNSGSLKTDWIPSTHIIQYLDVTCLVEGAQYDFSADFRVLDANGLNLAVCGAGQMCPKALLTFEKFDTETGNTYNVGSHWVGFLDGTYIMGGGFNKLKGSLTVSAAFASADKLRFAITHAGGPTILDNVSLKKVN